MTTMAGLILFIKVEVTVSPLLLFSLLLSSPLPDGCSLIKLSYLREVNTLCCPDYTSLVKRTMECACRLCMCMTASAYVLVCMDKLDRGGGAPIKRRCCGVYTWEPSVLQKAPVQKGYTHTGTEIVTQHKDLQLFSHSRTVNNPPPTVAMETLAAAGPHMAPLVCSTLWYTIVIPAKY